MNEAMENARREGHLQEEELSSCANCGVICHEDDLCQCESYCLDCHESHISPACADADTIMLDNNGNEDERYLGQKQW